jgi:hypothetical protein
MSEYMITSPSGELLLEQLPGLYESIREMRVMVETEGQEFDQLQQDIGELLDQYFVGTANWGLERWESEFGIVPAAGQPDDQRRSVIRSRIRGTGTVTVSLLKNVAEAYDRGSVEVTQQQALYQFTVRFVDTLGLPPNLDDLKAAIEDVKPAHLAVVFAFRYLLVSEVNSMTINQIQTHHMTDFAPFLGE